MTTRSTKSTRSKKARRKQRAAEVESARPVSENVVPDSVPESIWRASVIAIFVIAAVLRLYDLNLVPLHHDEGVNGNFLVRLVREGFYQYDPQNYHGPTLYYFSAIIPWTVKLLFGANARETYGLTTFTIRLIPALFGLGTIALVFLLRRRLGTIATLTAGLMLAVSPGAVYLSRYFIHETLFVFFTLGIVVAAVRFYDKRNPSYLIAAGASAALLFATKETAMISAGVLIIAFFLTLAYEHFNRSSFVTTTRGRRNRARSGLGRIVDEIVGSPSFGLNVGLAVVVFFTLYVLFYSSFFTYEKGLFASLQTFAIWKKTGTEAHVHPPVTYIYWLLREEGPLLLLGAIGAAIVVLRPKNSFAVFCALWSFGLIAAYSLIPYKTPWLLLNFVVPLALIAGYALQAVYELDQGQLRLVSVVLVLAIGVAVYQCIDLNFVNYDNEDEKYVYVYAHTKRSTLDLLNEIDRIAKQEQGGQTGITIVSPDYWPLPWYLRNYGRVGYYGQMAPSVEPIIIAREDQKDTMETNFGGVYEQVPSSGPGGTFDLRPGVKLLLYVRRA
ncbi:MAG TPA: flippase activity-associated protein Agl23 [Pyrinomonadaceae bacterium]|nr:flippase activity-associated protein Agl23 [Pyrinomonadaceae bacterium]